ncbi:hypothetical protein O6H91_03G080100 [Diphasiastrum complanatum]|uniref:Uncharacterized protein n=1 Tax=Diphasiastrum complanatum TaxID=34168 RepID=A0ACC2E7S0_DIPCM|nr:hypothetical protein O6H91_Y142200 [Diphasiastrum complanatum]KAJ7562678.1 hypothetical protein O6H91_03G080100 [Diphasiastrum complanatum]
MKKQPNGEFQEQRDSFVESPGRKLGGNFNGLRTTRLMLRLFGLLFNVAALFLIATNKQTQTIQFPGFFAFTKTAKFTSSKAFVYLLVATALAATYAFFHVINFIAHRGDVVGSTSIAWLVFVMDQALTYTLLGAVAASTELAYLGKHGFEDAGWFEICTYFNRFCNQMGVAVAIAYLATVCFGISAVFSAFSLFSRY